MYSANKELQTYYNVTLPFRFIVIFILMSCFGGCGYWRRRQLWFAQHHQAGFFTGYETYLPSRRFARGPHITLPVYPTFDTSYSTTSPPLPASGAEATGLFPSPPPYSEVSLLSIRKTELYVL